MRVSMRERKNGSFQFTISRGVDPDTGRQLRDYAEFHGTRTEARKEKTRLQAELDRGEYAAPLRYTVAQFLDEWLSVYGKANLAPLTLQRYQSIVDKHIKPAIGADRLQELTPMHVERMYAGALERVSASTVLYVHRVLHCALEWALRKRMVNRNVADAVDPPRTVRPEQHALDEDQTAAVLGLLESSSSDLYLPALVAVSTGVRRGELLALRWSDVDLDGLTMDVARSLQETRDGRTFKEPKNGRGRVVGIPPALVSELKAHRKAQAEHRLAMGIAYCDQGLIFPALDGSPTNPHAFTRKFDRFRDRHVKAARRLQAKLEAEGKAESTEHAAAAATERLMAFRWHDWRHSYASQQLRAGEQLLLVSKSLGHATTAFTMDVYGHVLPGEQTAAAERHGARLAAARARVASQG